MRERYYEHIESTYGTDPSSQPLFVDPDAYQFVVGEPNKGQYYGLGSPFTSVRHLHQRRLGDSHGSTSAPSDVVSSGSSPLNQSYTDEHLI